MQDEPDAQSHMPKQYNVLIHSTVRKFLTKLSREEWARANKKIELLKQVGPKLPEPHSSFLDGELRQLKSDSNRLIYMYSKKHEAYVIVHGFKKQTNQTPEQDKAIARKRVKEL